MPTSEHSTKARSEQFDKNVELIGTLLGMVIGYFGWRKLGVPRWAAVAMVHLDARLVNMSDRLKAK